MDFGFLAYPRHTLLELAGPWEVLSRLPNARTHLIWTRPGPILAEHGIEIAATVGFDDCPPLEVLMVPGGPGQASLMRHALLIEFLRAASGRVRYLCAVGSGVLLLAQAGTLAGKHAVGTGEVADALESAGVAVGRERFAIDGAFASATGAVAALDLAFELAARLAGPEVAEAIRQELG